MLHNVGYNPTITLLLNWTQQATKQQLPTINYKAHDGRLSQQKWELNKMTQLDNNKDILSGYKDTTLISHNRPLWLENLILKARKMAP